MVELKLILLLCVFISIYFIYFLPTLIAIKRFHYNKISIFICNLLFGWTCVGWVLFLKWAFNNNVEVKNN